MFQPNIYATILACTSLTLLLVAWSAWRRRALSPAADSFIITMLFAAGYSSVAALEAAAVTLSHKLVWAAFEYVAVGGTVVSFVLFAFHFTQQQRWLTRRRAALLWVIPAFNLGLVTTNAWHGLVWIDFLPGPAGSNQIVYVHGPGFYWLMLSMYGQILFGSFILLRAAFYHSILYRRQSLLAVLGALVPLLSSIAYALGLTPPGLNFVPMSFLFTGLIYFINLFHFGMLDLIPIARDTMVEKMNDGVLVMDNLGRIVDMNPAAQRLSGVLRTQIGKHADQALKHWPDLLHLCMLHDEYRTEMRPPTAPTRSIEIQMTALRDYRNRLTGKVLVLRDVSQRYRAEQDLRLANERLQEQLQEIEALQVKLREQATRDGLTNLFNRRYLEEWLEHELIRATREAYPVAVLVMDLDFFKQINDTYGHLDGDLVLQAFAQTLVRFSRMSDLACRYGGEEFVLVLPGMDLDHAVERAEQIRQAFQELPIHAGVHTIRATVSAGVGVFPTHGATPDDLLRAADDALYRAKASGRNRVCVAVLSPMMAR